MLIFLQLSFIDTLHAERDDLVTISHHECSIYTVGWESHCSSNNTQQITLENKAVFIVKNIAMLKELKIVLAVVFLVHISIAML